MVDNTTLGEVSPTAASWNHTMIDLNNMRMDSNFFWHLCSLVSAMAWVIYITYYNSRVMGYFVTRLLNRFVTDGYLSVGSLTCNVLSGKIMFRDIVYITHDYSVRVQDGWLIFRWWRSYVPKDVSEDLSHSDTRLSLLLNGFELHLYNRSAVYGELERLFGLEPQLFPKEEDDSSSGDNRKDNGNKGSGDQESLSATNREGRTMPRQAAALGHSWRDLIPVIKVDVCTGRVVFGNRLVPTTLSINVEEAHFVYSTKPSASRLDPFMHFVKCRAENFKVILAPSLQYTGMLDDPPRYMGEGFVVLSSNNVELYYYMDEPGLVPEEPEMLQLANGDIVESAPPIWGIDIKCGKGTDFSYGPWADRQREHLFKFFFPNNYQPLQVTKPLQPGEKRQAQSFDIRLSTLNEATVDVLFSKNKETNAVHINVGPGSYLEVTMPWVVTPTGYTTKVTGQLLHLEATTSLQYRSLVESETLEFNVKCHYPIKWNDHQEWVLNLTGCKATVNLIYAHKWFFQDLINDWSSKARPDLLHFVPYTWKFSLLLKEFEIITICNEYNWIDCSSQNQENTHIAFCGDLFDLSFDLPFSDFLPPTVSIRFWLQGESVDLALYLPDTSTSRCVLLGLDANAKVLGRDGNILQRTEPIRKWRNRCQKSGGWVDCWAVPIVALCINYTYHPAPPLGPPPQADITTPEKEELLLSPMRIPRCRKSPGLQWSQEGGQRFDPTTLTPDEVSLELEIGPSVLFIYGSWLHNFMFLKENIFGEDQMFTDMHQSRSSSSNAPGTAEAPGAGSTSDPSGAADDTESKPREFDPRQYRPIDVRVSITMHDIQGHLMKSCGPGDPPCPSILLERFGFEMKKGYRETQLQLLLSPAVLLSSDSVSRPGRDRHLTQGHLMLSGLQVRGHAMFSDEGRSLDQDTLEYAWLLEVQLGKLSGKLTAPQLHHLITSLETLVLLCKDSENELRAPRLPRMCHHGLPPVQCAESDPDNRYHCPAGDDIKYRMTRVAIDCVDLYLLENGTAVQLWASPIRLSTCNLHGQRVKSGVTAVLPAVRIRQLIASGAGFGANHSSSNTTGSGRSQHSVHNSSELWLEVGSASLGPLLIEAALSLPTPARGTHLVQHHYLKLHDSVTHRLWFLWSGSDAKTTGRCGCVGGCAFFGSNRNGPRFFRPCAQDLQDCINVAAFRVNESGRDPGFGQSILHEGQLVFHTPPYDSQDVSLQEPVAPTTTFSSLKVPAGDRMAGESPGSGRERGSSAEGNGSSRLSTASPSPAGGQFDRRGLGRRFSYTAAGGNKTGTGPGDVPYARLVEHSPTGLLAPKLDSDSRLDTGRSVGLSAPVSDTAPKSSASDSRLALDYFQTAAAPDSGIATATNLHSGESAAASTLPISVRESQQSLAATVASGTLTSAEADELLRQEVQRTTSMSSENHSEAFYSADEDVASQQASRASSLRHSTTLGRQDSSGPGTASSRKKFRSELSIAAAPGQQVNANAVLTGSTGPVSEVRARLSSHRSDHEIHTPEHRNQLLGRPNDAANDEDKLSVGGVSVLGTSTQVTNVANKYYTCEMGIGLHYPSEGQDGVLLDSSDTHSVSSTSFISAVSSQEDLTLVNLHMQVNKPIVDSPLLMSSYISHLSQMTCGNWSQSSLPSGCDAFTVPLFQRTEDGKLVYIGSRYSPRFDMQTEGFTSLKMVGRPSEGVATPPPPSCRTPTHLYVWDNEDLRADEGDDVDIGVDEELLALSSEGSSRTTVILKFKGDVDIMLSPLVLESLQRFIDAVTPTMAGLHPLTVLNHLHSGCISQVEAANILKRDHAYLAQLQASSKRSTAERGTNAIGTQAPALQSSVYEESISTQTQGTIVLPKVNITLLQVSVVEEVISFSALDNIRDLTCVSLFAVCFEGITTRFHIAKQAREVVQTFQRPAVLPGSYKKVSKMSKAFLLGHQVSAVGGDALGGEPVYIETSEKQQEETVVTLGISKIHAQLRRLKNESSILKDAIITAIPAHYSRVLFTCTRVSSPARDMDYYVRASVPVPPPPPPPMPPPPLQPVPESASEIPKQPSLACELSSGNEDSLGFIMFECGLEGVSIKVVKRSLFDKSESPDDAKGGPADGDTTYTDTVHSREDPEAAEKHVSDNTGAQSDSAAGNQVSNKNMKSTRPLNSASHFAVTVSTNVGSASTGGQTSAVTVSTVAPSTYNPSAQPVTTGGGETTGSGAPAGSSTPGTGEGSGAAGEEGTAETPSAVVPLATESNGNASSCVIEFHTMWFNFAAPPRAPITRKIDYTRLDWNLLSTASPAINAWMNPSNRFAIRLVYMIRSLYRRQTGIVASLMAEALDVQSIHIPSKSRYGRYTPLAKTLQEDPSCQLCSVLQKYVLQTDLTTIESNLADADLPMLSTLRQGVIVLSRQWKNVLYTPLLLEHNYKSKQLKPLNVKFTLPPELDEENVLTDGEGEGSGEECEVTDECAMLLNTEGSSHKGSLRPSHDKGGYGPLREEKPIPPHNMGSNPSIYSGAHGSHHSAGSLDNNLSPSGATGHASEDLYSWMAKQQDFTHHTIRRDHWESKLNTLTTEDTLEEPELLVPAAAGCSLYPMQDSLRLLDAHLIFEPLLSSLGVDVGSVGGPGVTGSSNMPSSLDTWGSNLSLVGSIDTMRVDIVVSEYGKTSDKKKKPSTSTKSSKHSGGNIGAGTGRFHLDIPPETPAFLCERMGVELDLRQQGDMTVDELVQRQNILYISRGQLKKHSSTVINVSLNVRYISQQVNMPLLRLLHQISNMYQNVKDTQMELKEQQPEGKQGSGPLDLGRKNNSSSTSDLQEHISNKNPCPVGDIDPGLLRPRKRVSPSASIRSRPQSFAQKLRSTSKSVKGYMNLSEGVTTPMFAVSPSGSGLEHVPLTTEKGKEMLGNTPRCWKTVYYLLELYASMPETKTIPHRYICGFSVAPDVSEGYKGSRKYDVLSEGKVSDDLEKGPDPVRTTPVPQERLRDYGVVSGERTRLVVFGVARIHRTRLLATLSGLKLEAEITSLHSSLTCRKKSRPASLECSLTGQVGRTMIVLLEGVAPSQQTVVRVTVGKSQALYSSITRRSKDKNSGLLTVGAVNVDIPQHPVALHGMMTRGSKQLSSTLQELRVTRTASRLSRGATVDETDLGAQHSPRHVAASSQPAAGCNRQRPESSLLQPLVMQFSIVLQSLSITAALLPSLQAQYKMDQVNSTGVTGSKAKFTIDLPRHSLSFTTKLQVMEANLPSEASIELPKVHVSAEYVQDGSNPREAQYADGMVLRQGSYLSAVADIGIFEHSLTTDLLNHLVFVQKVFMKEVNEVVQKVYGGEKPVPLWMEGSDESATASMKRILFSLVIRIKRIQLTATTPTNSAVRLETGAVELQLSNRVQNVSGSAQPNPYMKLFGKAQVDVNLSLGQLLKNVMFEEAEPEFQQYAFFKTRIGLRNAFQDEMVQGEEKEVVLITLRRPLMYIQPMAVDKAILVWLNYKNAYEYWNEQRSSLNKEVLTATQQVFEKVPFGQLTSQLSSPHLGTLFLQLTVDDMGLCLPLNPVPPASWGRSRQFYETESRGAVVVTLESTSISACSSGSLVSKGRFMGLCLRFADDFETSLDDWKPDMSDSTIMNLCVVSEGTYEVCSRTIAQKQGTDNAKWLLNVQWQMEGVDIHLDVNVGKQLSALGHTLTTLTGSQEDEEPARTDYDSDDADQPDGTAASLTQDSEPNLEQEFELEYDKESDLGSDRIQGFISESLNVDTPCEEFEFSLLDAIYEPCCELLQVLSTQDGKYDKSLESINLRRSRNFTDSLPAFVFDPSLDAKKRSKLIEKEMNEQAKIINDLRSLGASHGTIEQEMRRLQELEAMVFKDFRRDMIQKLRRQSVKASSIKGKFGLGSKANTYRSRSFIVPSPTPEHHLEMESPDDGGGASVNSNGNSASFESSPRSGPSRSASLRVRGLGGPRVTFSDTQNMCRTTPLGRRAGTGASAGGSVSRSAMSADGGAPADGGLGFSLARRQSSLPSAGSDLSLPEGEVEWGSHHMDIDGERVELRRPPPPGLIDATATTSASPSAADGSGALLLEPSALRGEGGGGCSPAAQIKPQEPNIDFELDVKVLINSGKCVLHTKDPGKEDELKLMSRMRKERSCSGGVFEFPPASPNSARRSKESKHNVQSTSRLRYLQSTVAQLVDLTIFHIPGLDVKVHYESHTLQEETAGLSPPTPRKSGTKKASLFAWMTLQSIPEETIISPHILEYLEQTLEPIPSSFQQAKTSGGVNAMFAMDQDSTWAAATASANYAYASFPVDVIVYFHMQPSTFRFSCLPVSRVECMLQLPSLDIVFSSKRAEEELQSEFGEGRSGRWDSIPSPSAVGGLSVTGCLADFSVYIFHPYGGGKKSGLKEAQWSPLTDSERKDSLSVNVEFVKFHLSRSRKLNFPCDQQNKGLKNPDQSQAVIRFSTIVDIGSASFKYDMRRLTEILAFPKAWYRRSIVRRLFLGDLSISAAYSEGEETPPTSPEEDPLLARSVNDGSGRHTDTLGGLSRSAPPTERSPMLPTRDKLRLSLENDIARHARARERHAAGKSNTPSPSDQKVGSAWETLVLFAVNFTRLNVHMNMGNVMGNVMWLTKDFKSEGRLSIGSNGHKNMYIGVSLGGSGLDAKGGIVGGAIELSKIDTYIHIREDPGTEPDHTIGLKLFALELRLDYMGTGVLMSRVSSLSVSLRDEWKITRSKASDGFMPTRRPAMIFLHGDLGWDQLQIMISKSTTADLLKMFYKLDEFFSQQFKSSKRVFSSLQPRAHGRPGSIRRGKGAHTRKRPAPASAPPPDGVRNDSTSSSSWDARHHRHWQRVLAHVCGLQLSTLSFPLPRSGTVLGGTMELHGNNISLACFHGINFKSKSWALFSLKEPCISFATEAQEVPSTEVPELLDVHVVQTLTFSLGMTTDQAHAQHHSMATVCRLSRNVLFPPQFRTLQEWFHYAFSCSDIDAVDRFPSLERERERAESATEPQRTRSSGSSKLQEHSHTREVIFALPSLQLHVKTEHLQAAKTPDGVGSKPVVECSFITEFEDHIFVTVDAEAFFFLHDLISSYVKERERVSGMRAHSPDHERRSGAGTSITNSDEERKRKAFDPGEMFTKDWRSYQCKTWHLEPTVRLLSWGGKSIEPYGVDYILQKLGFSHARTTIPKWMQRGFMDPLDKVLAVLMLRMILAVREETSRTDAEERK